MKTSIRSATLNAFCLSILLALLSFGVSAQTSNTDGNTPAGLSPGAPAGSYSLSGFENVNLYNGNLNVSLPLLPVGGRGSAGYTVTLAIEQKWRVEQFAVAPPGQPQPLTPIGNWWGALKPGYGPGVMEGRRGGYGDWLQETYCGSASDADNVYMDMLTRLTFTAGDGTEYELLDLQTGGQPINLTSVPCGTNGNSRGKVFVTADGSAATFFSDAPISDYKWKPMGTNDQFRPSGYLWLRDGTRYRIDNGLVSWLHDRNGNRVTFAYSADRITSATDSLNRQVTFSYAGGGTAYDQISFKGFGGQDRSIKIWKAAMGSVLRSGFALQTYAQLFPDFTGASSSTQFNPSKVSAVELPNGRTYQFRYNSYGEVARIELPTGGAMEYDWINANSILAEGVIYRRVSERRLYKDGSNLENKITYSNPGLGQGVEVKTFNSAGTLLAYSKHYHCGSALDSLSSEFTTPISYPLNLAEGREVQTDVFSTNGTTVLRRVQNTWDANGTLGGRSINPRLVETVQTIEPAGANLISKQTFNHDQYNNQTDVYEYGFRSGGVDPLVRRTHTDYFASGYDTLNPSSSNPDPSLTSHIRNLPWKVFTYDGAGTLRAKVQTEYDNYVLDGTDCLHSFHCALQARSNISGLDSQFTTSYTKRGNPTAVTSYLISNGTETGSITAYSQYDVAGNVVRVLDPRSTLTNNIANTIEYDDRFGSPDNEARSNSAPSQLAGSTSFAFPTKVINALGHTSYAQFDYYLGKPVNGEDANGGIASGYFNDSLGRPTQIRRAVGTGNENQTTFAYDDANRIVTTSSDRDANNDNILVSKVLYDQLGRTIENRQYEGGSNYIVIQTQYDSLGRAFKASNPFRPWQSETAVWTTQAFDALGRVISVTTPDNAAVTTSYSANVVTVTDQAGKVRRSVTDALGRLIQVNEDPNGVDLQTTYLYDILDNLVKVTQDGQQRFFMYDSLKRLIRARNPEQATRSSLNLSDPITNNSAWSIAYQYDVSGNLTQKTDARGVVSTYVYDGLNRNTSITYTNDPGGTLPITRVYDTATKGKGFLHYSQTTGTGGSLSTIDAYDELGRPTNLRQQFYEGGAWSTSYTTSRTYNLAGGVILQTYPSGRTVSYNYDAAGRLADKDAQNLAFSGDLGDNTTRTYSAGILYSPFGGMVKEQFGTNTALYHKLFYNIRGQLFDTRLSSVNDTWDWNRGRLILYYSSDHVWGGSGTDNNGNVLFAQTWIPPENATLDQAESLSEQNYEYDSLNRLKSVAEQRISTSNGWVWQPQFKQSYNYDQYGNRTIKTGAADTWGTGINNRSFEIESTTNRLYSPGDIALADTQRRIRYDEAGNQFKDTYTGYGNATFDAENRIITIQDNLGGSSTYTYNADGQRTRRKISNQETWQVYGFGGELLAEYAANGAVGSPQKEYGYRNGQLLVTAETTTSQSPPLGVNVAAASNGAVATASSTINGVTPSNANNGDHIGTASWWADDTSNSYPDWIQVEFSGSKTISEINVFGVQQNYSSPVEPTATMTSNYALTNFEVQYWTGSAWATVPGGSVTGNDKVWRKFTFAPLTTTKIRVHVTNVAGDNRSQVVEIEAYGPANVALTASGAVATASSTYSGVTPSKANNGDHVGTASWWADDTSNSYPDWIQVEFAGSKTIGEIDVFGVQQNYSSPVEPTATMTSSYALTNFEVQYWTGSAWATVPGGSVTGNDKVWRKFTFAPLTTTKIRVHVTNVAGDNRSQVVEIEAYTATASPATIRWLVSDHLGTPRMIVDQTGNLANMKRHDYLPFGEELFAGTGGRSAANGYGCPPTQQGCTGDKVRQQFTSKERDVETSLDYFGARYYASIQGRFTGPDRMSGSPSRPQSWNAYTYVLNRPLRLIDPDGLRWAQRTVNGNIEYRWFATEEEYNAATDSDAQGYEGWAQVGFNELEAYEYVTANGYGIGGESHSYYRLNPDGTHGYVRTLNGSGAGLSTDWGAQLAIGGILQGGMGIVGAGLDAGIGALLARTAGSEMLTGFYSKVSVATLESAASSGGPTVQVFTRLDQAPTIGKTLHMAYEEAGTRAAGQLYQGQVPKALVEQLKRSGLAFEKVLQWTGKAGAVRTYTELQVMPQAARFVIPFLK